MKKINKTKNFLKITIVILVALTFIIPSTAKIADFARWADAPENENRIIDGRIFDSVSDENLNKKREQADSTSDISDISQLQAKKIINEARNDKSISNAEIIDNNKIYSNDGIAYTEGYFDPGESSPGGRNVGEIIYLAPGLQGHEENSEYFLHISDIHWGGGGDANWYNFVNGDPPFDHWNINDMPKFVICTGDIVEYGSGTEGFVLYEEIRQSGTLVGNEFAGWVVKLRTVQGIDVWVPILFAPGNHDFRYVMHLWPPPTTIGYKVQIRWDLYYMDDQVDQSTIRIFSLNSGFDLFAFGNPWPPESDGLYSGQLDQLEADLDALDNVSNGEDNSGLIKVIMFHHPYRNWESYWPYWEGVFWYNDVRFKNICINYNVDLVCWGHTHDSDSGGFGSGKYSDAGSLRDTGTYNKVYYKSKTTTPLPKSLYAISDILECEYGDLHPIIQRYNTYGDETLWLDEEDDLPVYLDGAKYLAIDTDSDTLFVNYHNPTLNGGNEPIKIIDASTFEELHEIYPPDIYHMRGMVKDQSSDLLYVTSWTAQSNASIYIYEYDDVNYQLTLTNTVTLPNCIKARDIALDEINGLLFVADSGDDTVPGSGGVRYYNTTTWIEEGNFQLIHRPHFIDVDVSPHDPSHQIIYTTGSDDSLILSKADLDTGTETIVNMGHGGGDIVVDPATKLIYVCSYDNNRFDNISVWDSDLNLLYRTPPIEYNPDETPRGMCIEGKQKYIWIDDDNTEGPWNGTLKDPYQHIQDGIDNASDGYTVYVFNGFYQENIVIDKSISLLGENKELAIINGSGDDTVVTISVDEVEFNGFTIINSGSSHAGISVYSDNNTIFENKIIFNNHGIFLDGASNNTISENVIINNTKDGVIVKSQSCNNNLSKNTISFNDGNGINISEFGWENIVCENTIEENGDSGIKLYENSIENVIIENTITNNDYYGVYIPNIGSRNFVENVIVENSLTNNDYYNIYIPITSSDNNVLFHNNFIDNNNGGVQAYDECDNIWNDTLPSGGNYWSDYTGADPDRNGIGNTPYNISGSSNQDQHPFIIQNGWKAIYVDDNNSNPNWYDARHVATIQEGIANAIAGDTIYVYTGTYLVVSGLDGIIVDKPLTIIGQDRDNTIIKGEVSGNVVSITAPEVTFNNFTITRDYLLTAPTCGIDISSNRNTITGNIITGSIIRNNDNAIYIHDNAEFNNINNNIISETEGIWIYKSDNNIIDSNMITDIPGGDNGILIEDSSNNNIYNNTIKNYFRGIKLIDSSNNNLIANNVSDIQDSCIYLENSKDNIFGNNTFTVSATVYGFFFKNVYDLNNDIDASNTVNGNAVVVLSNVRHNLVIEGINVEFTPQLSTSATNYGVINLYKCSNVTIKNCTIVVNDTRCDGIFLYDSYDNTLDNITVRNSRRGIWVEGLSNNNTIENNNCSDNSWNGIHLGPNSNNNTIANNTCYANWQEGIYLYMSRDNKLLNNTCTKSNYGIKLQSSNNNLLLGNNCSSNWVQGISLEGSNNNVLKNNDCLFNQDSGIYFYDSSHNEIENNNISWNNYGIDFYSWSYNNQLFENTISHNNQYGIHIGGNNGNNRIYHNNFINNKPGGVQACDYGIGNLWNDLYFFGGNYWDDFNGGGWGIHDDYTGENQDQQVPPGQPTPDGIIDRGPPAGGLNPYIIFGGNNQDLYPLMYPWNGIPLFDAVINIDTGESFPTIQEAIDDSDTLNGHTIYVQHGTYYENVIVGKSINLIGEDKDTTIIDGSQTGNVIRFDADWVNISGFTIANSSQYGYGIYYFPNYPYTDYAENVSISGNIIEGCRIGIGITRGYSINISRNIIRDCLYSGVGISLSDSYNTVIFENELINTGFWGISLAYDANNTVILRNTLAGISSGIFIGFSSNCNISENTITEMAIHGIRMWDSSNNIISENNIHDNLGDGIMLLTLSDNNKIYYNNFIDNNAGNAYDECNNTWDDGISEGNYWDDFEDNLGYPDVYEIPGGLNVDRYPLNP